MEISHELYLQAIKCGSEAARIMTGCPAQKDRLGSWFKKTKLFGGRSAGVCLLRYTPLSTTLRALARPLQVAGEA